MLKNINAILDDYKPQNDLFSEEDFEINRIKNIIYNDLDEVDRRIILMYADCGSLRTLGKELGVCASTVRNKIIEIRNKIYDKYNNNSGTTSNYSS